MDLDLSLSYHIEPTDLALKGPVDLEFDLGDPSPMLDADFALPLPELYRFSGGAVGNIAGVDRFYSTERWTLSATVDGFGTFGIGGGASAEFNTSMPTPGELALTASLERGILQSWETSSSPNLNWDLDVPLQPGHAFCLRDGNNSVGFSFFGGAALGFEPVAF